MTRRPTIGARGRRFTLETPLDTPDGFGGVLRSFASGPQLWGAIELLRSSEELSADQLRDVATHRVTFPYRDAITPAARLSLGTRRFRIRHAGDPDGRRRTTVCLVEEIAP